MPKLPNEVKKFYFILPWSKKILLHFWDEVEPLCYACVFDVVVLKHHFFFAYEFFISETIKWKSVLATKKDVFQGANTETVFPKHLGWGETIKTHKILRKQHLFPFLGYVSYIFPISAFLSKFPAGKKLGEISTKIKQQK